VRVLRRSSIQRRRTRTAAAFLAPASLVLGVFVLYPMLDALRASFTDARIIGPADWVGLANYAELLADDRFWNALWNTALYAVVTAPLSVAIALGLALMLNRAVPARLLFRAIIFFPFVTSLSLVSIAWAFLFDPQVGTAAAWLSQVGLPIGNGINDPQWAMPAVMLVGIWRNIGFFMVMFLAGLQSIPRELKEAAAVDGAAGFRHFRTMTWPLLANTTMFVVVIAAIFAFQAFDQMYVMTGGGPFFSTETLVMYIYDTGFEQYRTGYASAVSWALVLVVLTISIGQLWYFRKRAVQY